MYPASCSKHRMVVVPDSAQETRTINSMNIVKLPCISLREFVASTIIKNCRLHCVCTSWSVGHVWDGES